MPPHSSNGHANHEDSLDWLISRLESKPRGELLVDVDFHDEYNNVLYVGDVTRVVQTPYATHIETWELKTGNNAKSRHRALEQARRFFRCVEEPTSPFADYMIEGTPMVARFIYINTTRHEIEIWRSAGF